MARIKYFNGRWGYDGSDVSFIVEDGLILDRCTSNPTGQFELEIDLNQRWVLPKFVDNHSHIEATGTYLGYPSLQDCNMKQNVLDRLSLVIQEKPKVLIAIQYDQNKWGGDHLRLDELDRISTTIPIFVKHSNGHAAVCNTAAFQLANLGLEAPDPPSGQFGRTASGALSGLLLEGAAEAVSRRFPILTFDELKDSIRRGLAEVQRLGFREVSDMGSQYPDPSTLIKAYGEVAAEEHPVKMRIYLHWKDVFGPRAIPTELIQDFRHLIAGVKIFADGAIGSATAAIYGKFASNQTERASATRGKADAQTATSRPADGLLMYPPERLNEMVRVATDAGYQVATHAIGDLAVDLVMDAYEACGAASKHRIEHAMILSDAQIGRLADLDCSVSVQPEFLSRFGAAYRTQLGDARGSNLIRTKSLLNAGVKLSASTDRPIVEGDPRRGIELLRCRPAAFSQSENISGQCALQMWLKSASLANGTLPNELNPGQPFEALAFDTDPNELTADSRWESIGER